VKCGCSALEEEDGKVIELYYTGIDIGSSSAKAIVLDENDRIVYKLILPTGWSSLETANRIKEKIAQADMAYNQSKFVATGYGRVSVPYADKTVSEITCHGKGAAFLFDTKDCTVIDIGGQDTKIISLAGGRIVDFLMNDKCSAGTGRFLEIMANTLGVSLERMFALAATGSGVRISSMCTVFAESEVISLIGGGQPKQDIAYGVIESIANKVISLCGKHSSASSNFYLTGGLCESDYIIKTLSKKLETTVVSSPLGRYAGAIGAALVAKSLE
jgi:predicted CoA-substrate-specific enzyme activase